MRNESHFEQFGLKIDKERVLTYSQLSCPLDCRYCFVEDLNRAQKFDTAYLTEDQIKQLENLPEEIKLIMLGCDTEFFQHKEEALVLLDRLSLLQRDISVVTKLALNDDFLQKLFQIKEVLNKTNNDLYFSVSLPCLKSAEYWEPKAPKPELRIKTLERAHDQGLKTLTAIRPLIPTISEAELESLVQLTHQHCFGYYSGPLYLKDICDINIDRDPNIKTNKIQPHWMLSGNEFYQVEKAGQMNMLQKIVEKFGQRLFKGAAEATKHLKNEKY